MTTTEITLTAKVALLKHLASGKSLDVVATIVRLTRDQVLDIASHHGYPDRDKLAWAADILDKKGEEASAAAAVKTGPLEQGVTLDREEPAQPRPVVVATSAPAVGGIEDLVATGKGHGSKRIQAAANKVLDDVDRLRTLIREDQTKNAAKRKAQREKAQARAEIERLEQQLADAKAKLRGGKTPAKKPATDADGPSAAEVRAWAAENGVECTTVGIVPAAVRKAYDEAHMQAAS